jgi:hypothetical protein
MHPSSVITRCQPLPRAPVAATAIASGRRQRRCTAHAAAALPQPQPAAPLKRGVEEKLAMPPAVAAQIRDANAAWVQWAVANPLKHASGARVYLAPVCCWAPLQW